jgi:hypothetical protein
MSQLSDFEFDEAELPGASGANAARAASTAAAPVDPAGQTPASPVIVVEHRSPRGLVPMLAPPALILLVAVVITSSQRTQPVRFLVPRPVISGAASSPTQQPLLPADTKIIVHAAKNGEQITPVEALTANAKKPDATQPLAPNPDRSPFELDPTGEERPEDPPIVRVVPFDAAAREDAVANSDQVKTPRSRTENPAPDAIAAVVNPAGAGKVADFGPMAEPAGPGKEDILDDIERESKEKGAEKDRLKDQKLHVRGELLSEVLERVEIDRAAFREDLDNALKKLGNDAGPEISRLCELYGRQSHPEVQARYRRALLRAPARMSDQAKVNLMRSAGLSEPMVLDNLTETLKLRTMKSREGPRDPNEARVLAARQLLNLPVKAPINLATPKLGSSRSRILPQPAPRP